MGFLYLGGLTIQEVGGIMMMSLSIYGVVVISRSLCSRFYSISIIKNVERASTARAGARVPRLPRARYGIRSE